MEKKTMESVLKELLKDTKELKIIIDAKVNELREKYVSNPESILLISDFEKGVGFHFDLGDVRQTLSRK